MSTSISARSGNPTPNSATPWLDPESLRRAWRRGVTPPPRITMVEWAERHRKLSRESSHGGKFLVSRVEVARGPMLSVTEAGVREITLMSCTQLLKTTFIENVIGFFAHQDPCPILGVFPKDGAAETFAKDRLGPMIRDTKVLRELFGEARSRDAGSTIAHKQFPGGHVTLVGANSPTNLAQRPIRIIVADEIDKYPASAGPEGDPILLAAERLAEFQETSLIVRACSPTIAGKSAIEAAYLESDQRHAFVHCPCCGEAQELVWEQVKFDKSAAGRIRPETARYECAHCRKVWTEAERLFALRMIRWRQMRPFDCCGEQQVPDRWNDDGRALCPHCGRMAVSNEHAGFLASKLYAPRQTLADLVKKFRRAHERGVSALMVFWNTQLARTWQEKGEAPDHQRLYERREQSWKIGTALRLVLLLTAGIDVQKDRIELYVWGWGRGLQSWLVDRKVLMGDPARPEVWQALSDALAEDYENEAGARLRIMRAAVDTAYSTNDVYAWAREQRPGFVLAIKGQPRASVPIGTPTAVDVTIAGKRIRRGIKLWPVGVSLLKSELYGWLRQDQPEQGGPHPRGYVHLPGDVDREICQQLVAEQLVTLKNRRQEWQKLRERNEALDCWVYARAAAAQVGIDRYRESHWRELEEILGVTPEPEAPATVSPVAARQAVTRARGRRVSRSNYLGRG